MKKKILGLIGIVLFALSSGFTYANNQTISQKVVENVNKSANASLYKVMTNWYSFWSAMALSKPDLVVEDFNNIITECGNAININKKALANVNISPSFTKYCRSNKYGKQEIFGFLSDKNFLTNIRKMEKIFTFNSNKNGEIDAVNKIITSLDKANANLNTSISSSSYEAPSEEWSFNLIKLFYPSANKKTFVCVLSSPESSDGYCDKRSPHYKMFLGKMINNMFLKEMHLFFTVGNKSILNPIVSLSILLYYLFYILMIFYVAFLFIDFIFPVIRETGKRKLIFLLNKDYSLKTILTELLFTNNSTIFANNYSIPTIINISWFRNKISLGLSFIVYLFIFLIILNMSTYLF